MEQEVILWEQKGNYYLQGLLKMRIAIISHNTKKALELKRIIYDCSEQRRFDTVADIFINYGSFLKATEKYNIVFILDGDMIKTAEMLKKGFPETQTVIVSENVGIAPLAIKAEVFRFIISPFTSEEIYSTLEDFFLRFGTDYPILVKSGEDTVCLNTNEVYYIEADNKYSVLHLKSEKMHCKQTMGRVFDAMPKHCFVKINRAYVVNLNKVSRYNNDYLVLKNGERVHISRNYLKSFKTVYAEYLA